MPVPIWKDYEVSLGNVDEADYTIETGGVEIFSGHAVRRPDAAALTVRINDVCADHLSHALPSVTTRKCTADPCVATFAVKVSGTTVDTVTFIADWSYDHGHTAGDLCAPIARKVSAAQALVLSVSGGSNVSASVRTSGGSTSVTVSGSGGAAQSVTIPMDAFPGALAVTVAGITWEVVPACARHALVYVNAFGGWDTLLCEGRTAEGEDYDRRTMLQRYDNAVQSARGTVEYANGVTRRWTLRTGWLTDEGAANAPHLLGSTEVYLYDIVDKTLTPVVITETSCEVRTYRGQGGKMFNYTVGVALAADNVRR